MKIHNYIFFLYNVTYLQYISGGVLTKHIFDIIFKVHYKSLVSGVNLN